MTDRACRHGFTECEECRRHPYVERQCRRCGYKTREPLVFCPGCVVASASLALCEAEQNETRPAPAKGPA